MYVTQLIGIVSIPKQPYVIMEFMGFSDMKRYLMDARPEVGGTAIEQSMSHGPFYNSLLQESSSLCAAKGCYIHTLFTRYSATYRVENLEVYHSVACALLSFYYVTPCVFFFRWLSVWGRGLQFNIGCRIKKKLCLSLSRSPFVLLLKR